jgi:ribosomal protein S26
MTRRWRRSSWSTIPTASRRGCARSGGDRGLDGILAELNCGGKIPQDRVVNALRLLCQEVKPRFH